MSPVDMLSSFVDALIGGVVAIALIRVNGVVTRMRRQRRYANRQFRRHYRAGYSTGGRRTVAATPSSPRVLTVRLSIPGAAESAAYGSRSEVRRAA
jgi:hypothetical protein